MAGRERERERKRINFGEERKDLEERDSENEISPDSVLKKGGRETTPLEAHGRASEIFNTKDYLTPAKWREYSVNSQVRG